jgi:eukaryotic-like serine/threonine-protein kinase
MPLSRIGKYELEKHLGGTMAAVYQARDTVLGRRVAVKLLSDSGMADAEARERFLQEARLASSIRHENIIGVLDFGEEHGRPYLVMEFVEGESLRDAIRDGHLGALGSRLKLAIDVARAVDHIHSRKILHRDLKPENIHVDPEGKARLMDFGIAKAEGVKLTRSGYTLGTPYYMPPEQVLGKTLTPQADVYAFGILLYELLTGVRPLKSGSVEQIFQAVLTEPLDLEPLKALRLPEPLFRLIERCTAKEIENRPSGLGDVGAELERILQTTPAGVLQSAPSKDASSVKSPLRGILRMIRRT